MDIAPVTVSHELTLELIDTNGQATPLEAELCYDSVDPYAIAACFDTGGGAGPLGLRPRAARVRPLRADR